MARWVITVQDEVVWQGDTSDKGQVQQLKGFMDTIMGNMLPNAYPQKDKFDPRDWRHLVRASCALIAEYHGPFEIVPLDFKIDQLLPELEPQPEDAVN